MDIAVILYSGYREILEYLSAHVLTCLVPAFFIAGGIASFVSGPAVLKYFGPKTNKWLSYGVASVSGVVLAVCSCTVLPLFAGIYKKGAGIGPATAFLYSGPAINLLAVVLTARKLGPDLGVARAAGAVIFAVVIGLIMAFAFRGEETAKSKSEFPSGRLEKSGSRLLAFFGVLVAILVFGTAQISFMWKTAALVLLLVLLGVVLYMWFDRSEVGEWLDETWKLVRLIFPVLLAGVFIAGMLKVILPPHWISNSVGGNSLQANFIASFAGALMYFSTLTEVPILDMFLHLGMGRGPALALLLAGPALSLPNMLVIRSVMGTRKTLLYVMLVVVMATVSGMVFGAIAS